MSDASIDVLLATYNGERFLREQLDSLFAQDDQDFRIIARDDGSQDGTQHILDEFASGHPGRLLLIQGERQGVRGACGNFAELLARSTAPYVMFCDQDDRWHADKVSVSRAAMAQLERRHGVAMPLLVHGDLQVVDTDLVPIAPSLAGLLHLDLNRGSRFNRLLMHNAVTGCTMFMNRALVAAACPIPAAATMHDWWVALVAAAMGEVTVLSQLAIDYRQHDRNVLGAMGMSWSRVVGRMARGRTTAHERLDRGWQQAEELWSRHGGTLDPARSAACQAFLAMREQGFWSRRRTLIRHGFWMNGWVRNVGLLAVL